MFSSPAASRDTTHTGFASHSHTGTTCAVSSAEQICSEKLSERDHQHLLSPQSWIWVFSCSVSQENRADLPSSSSYFRSLTKCCNNRHVKSESHSEQKTSRPNRFLTLPCSQDLCAEPSIFPSSLNYTSQPSDGWITVTLGKWVISVENVCLITEPEAIRFTCWV